VAAGTDFMRRPHIYIVGVVLLGLGYESLKRALPEGWMFFLIAVVYLLVVRWIANRFGKP
jgi:hypothetical protein